MVKCVFCHVDILDNRSMEICDKCGVGVWGLKQWNNIKKTTDEARDRGDLSLFKELEEENETNIRLGEIIRRDDNIVFDVDSLN